MKPRTSIIVAVGALLATATSVAAAIYLDWADEFVAARAFCKPIANGMICTVEHNFDGATTGEPPTWAYLGNQGASAGGRANAKEKIFTQWYENSSSYAFTVTFNLSRYRTTSPPSEGTGCGTYGSFVGSVSYTKDSSVFQPADWDISQRLKPVYDFTQETAGAGTTVGYRSVVTSIPGGGGGGSITGCYKILWF